MLGKYKVFAPSLGILVPILSPILAFAQGTAPLAPFTTLNAFQGFICTVVVGWLFTFFIILSIVLVLGAAYYILTSSGDPERVKSGNAAILYAVLAIVLALFARGFPLIIGSLFAGGTGVSC